MAVPAPGVPKQSQIISAWVQSNPDVKWATAKVEIEKLITAAGLKFVEKSDVQQFSKARSGATGGKQSKVKSAVSGEVSLKKFAALTVNIDPAVLADAIKVIGQVGGIEAATTLGKKWGELCEAIGEE